MEKKQWNKYKRKMKKLGFTSVEYTYNVYQQRNRTATINLGSLKDPERFIAEAKAKLANDEYLDTEALSSAHYYYDYIKRNRKLYDELFIPSAKKKVATHESGAEQYLQRCLDECSHYDDGTYLTWKTQQERQEHIDNLTKSIASWEAMPSHEVQVSKIKDLFTQIAHAEPTKDLLSEINGQIILDMPCGADVLVYARIQF